MKRGRVESINMVRNIGARGRFSLFWDMRNGGDLQMLLKGR